MARLLSAGFYPFGGEQINPAWEAVKSLPDKTGEFALCKLEIPTVFGKAARAVLEKAAAFEPDVVICVGQAGGRASVTPERIGVNIRDARICDNEGNQPRGEFVDREGPAAYFATVPVMAMAEAMEQAGIPATVSNSAGAFVCNDVLYSLLHHYHGSAVRVGFIHVPFVPEQAEPSMPLEQITAALEAGILVL